jgi:predicted nucleic acid-binding Zn ribbon protein
MIYRFTCTNCNTTWDVQQRSFDKHTYRCPICDQLCVREWTVPQVKRNEGFFTESFKPGGEWVNSYKEYDEKLARVRTITGMDNFLGVNQVKDEYREIHEKDLQRQRREVARSLAEKEEWEHQKQEKGIEDAP